MVSIISDAVSILAIVVAHSHCWYCRGFIRAYGLCIEFLRPFWVSMCLNPKPWFGLQSSGLRGCVAERLMRIMDLELGAGEPKAWGRT